MKLSLGIIALLATVSASFETNVELPTTGVGGSSGPDKVAPNRDVGMVMIDGVYHSYSIYACDIAEGLLLALYGKGTTENGRPFHITAGGEEQLIKVSIEAFEDSPEESYTSVPFAANEIGLEIINRTISAHVNFRRNWYMDELSGLFRAECR